MADLFQNKYRISSARMRSWDYGWNAQYFVTICTRNRDCFFGDVIDNKMHLSDIGEIANAFWIEIADHFPFVILHPHTVMPNHVHGIIEIAKNDAGRIVETQNLASIHRETQDLASLPSNTPPHAPPTTRPKNKFGPQSRNLGSIIRGFKSAVTIDARKIIPHFTWQPRFHDHIIRDRSSYDRICTYIKNNPKNWNQDKFYK